MFICNSINFLNYGRRPGLSELAINNDATTFFQYLLHCQKNHECSVGRFKDRPKLISVLDCQPAIVIRDMCCKYSQLPPISETCYKEFTIRRILFNIASVILLQNLPLATLYVYSFCNIKQECYVA